MIKKQYDAIVIGAGPSGSICAMNIAKQGYEVLQVEKRPVVGVPVRCGEATGTRQRLSEFVEINEDYIESDVHGVILHHPNHYIKYDEANVGLMLDRALFDQDLAKKSEEAGAQLLLDARVSNVHPYQNGKRKISLVYDGQEIEVEANIVVAADGVESLCGQWAGLKSRQMAAHVCSAIEFRVEGMDEHPNHLSFWLHYKDIPKGYVWVFPKIKSNVINIGAGTITPKAKQPNMYDVTMEFKEKFFPNHKLLDVHGGSVPVSGNLQQSVADGFLLTGDAAHHTDPLTGGGIASGMLAGSIAAKWVCKSLEIKDNSESFLEGYHKHCWDEIGKHHLHQIWIREWIFKIGENTSDKFWNQIKFLVEKEFKQPYKTIGYSKIAMMLLSNFGLVKNIWKSTKNPPSYKK